MRCYHARIAKKPISLCSHTDAHPNLNREVRHSLTWHSSKSESALERFEPVAVVQQLPDGRGTLFALVAARRQGEIYKRWNASYMTFAALFVSEKREKRKVTLCIVRVVVGADPYKIKSEYSQ